MSRRPWPVTLRGRLIAGLLVLLAAACAAVGAASVIALNRSLMEGLDRQLAADGGRFAASLEHAGEHRERPGDDDDLYTGEGDSRGQAPGTLGARLVAGRVTHADMVPWRGRHDVLPAGRAPRALSAADAATLAGLAADGRPRTVGLAELGDYRVAAVRGDDGDVLVTGLPLHEAEETVRRLEMVELAVFAAALLATGVAGALWVGVSLRPLRRVAATAGVVAGLPLADGEVALPGGVPHADPRTEVGQVGAAFNRMLEHVGAALARRHESEQRLRRFAADASHELRTPLAAIRGHAELARRHPGPVPPEVRHALDRVQAESVRMGRLVDDLLLLARLDAGRPLRREEVDLTRLAIDATGDARAAGPEHRWRLELPEEPVTVTGDADRLHQVLVNLLNNARIHTPPGTTVTVSVAGPGRGRDHAELSVADDGPGVPAEFQHEVFDRFARADRGRARASGGTGLGLAIVQAVAHAHGGTVALDGVPGRTVFTVTLPASPDPSRPAEQTGPS
ncbi:sensor histidine kinase [Sphaerisporangium rufum]|uniref:histidine kinase n=1 Tax=Sphaerisporangium rufum TaxID=1381558 RepID=A0A919R3Y1_9ACTN|nr:HAMP domain-containing sensor histidine kinase [Sphaerisporangium rufum]GII78623.1 sensor histidine kinase [Sphaerisporangium rufum]